jgi:hypothetical protein
MPFMQENIRFTEAAFDPVVQLLDPGIGPAKRAWMHTIAYKPQENGGHGYMHMYQVAAAGRIGNHRPNLQRLQCLK